METKNQDIMTDTVGLNDLTCNGVICVPLDHYENLVRAAIEREILFHAYQQMEWYRLEDIVDMMFNPKFKFKKDGGNA